MHFIATLFFTTIILSFCSAQEFENAIESIKTELEYELQKSIEETVDLEYRLAERFRTCSKFQNELLELNYESISACKSAELKQPFHDGNFVYSRFQLIEIRFKEVEFADQFKSTLDKLGNQTECISKGGILWWAVEERLYFIGFKGLLHDLQISRTKKDH